MFLGSKRSFLEKPFNKGCSREASIPTGKHLRLTQPKIWLQHEPQNNPKPQIPKPLSLCPQRFVAFTCLRDFVRNLHDSKMPKVSGLRDVQGLRNPKSPKSGPCWRIPKLQSHIDALGKPDIHMSLKPQAQNQRSNRAHR